MRATSNSRIAITGLTSSTVSGEDGDIFETVDLRPDVPSGAFTESQLFVHGVGNSVDIGIDHGQGEGNSDNRD